MKNLIVLLLVILTLPLWQSANAYDRWNNMYYLEIASDTATDSIYSEGYFTYRLKGQKTLIGKVIMGTAIPAYTGVGNDDSCWIWLYSIMNDEQFIIDSAVAGSLPCTLDVTVPNAVGDTLLRDELYLKYLIYDSLSDTVITFNYPLYWNIIFKD